MITLRADSLILFFPIVVGLFHYVNLRANLALHNRRRNNYTSYLKETEKSILQVKLLSSLYYLRTTIS